MEMLLLLYLRVYLSVSEVGCTTVHLFPQVPMHSGALCFTQAFISFLLFPSPAELPALTERLPVPFSWKAAACVRELRELPESLSSETLLFQSHIDLSAAANVYSVCCRCFA